MIVDLVKLAFLTLVAADLEADLSSARKAASAFEDILWDINHTSTGSDVPTSLTSDYVSFISAFSSFNGALEGVGADDFTSGSISLYNDAAAVFFYMGFVLLDLSNLATLYGKGTGNILSFVQGAIEGMNEPSIQLVEKINPIMAEDCRRAIYGHGGNDYPFLRDEVFSFSSQFSSAAEEVSVTISSLPTLSCLNSPSTIIGSSTLGRASSGHTSSGSYATPTGADTGASTADESSTLGDASSGSYATLIRSSEGSESGADEDSQSASSTTSGISTGTSQSSTLEGSTSTIDSSTSPESLLESSTQRETAVTSTSSNKAGNTSTRAASVTSGRAPVLALNVGIFVPLFAMLL